MTSRETVSALRVRRSLPQLHRILPRTGSDLNCSPTFTTATIKPSAQISTMPPPPDEQRRYGEEDEDDDEEEEIDDSVRTSLSPHERIWNRK